MQTLTDNYQLNKYDQGDNPGAEALNDNWDTIDEVMAEAAAGQAVLGTAGFLTLAVEADLPASKRLQGTANQVVLTVNAGDLVLSLPQDIHTGATPRFTGLTIGSSATEGLDVSVVGSQIQILEKGAFPGYSIAFGTQNLKNVEVWVAGGPVWVYGNAVGAGGHFFPYDDNSYDVGLASFKPRNVRWGTQALGPLGTVGAPAYSFSAASTYGIYSVAGTTIDFALAGARKHAMDANGFYILSDTATFNMGAGVDVILVRDAAAVLALKNGTTAQTFRVYGTTTGPKYIGLLHDGTNASLVETGGGALIFGTNGSARFYVDGGGIVPSSDNVYSNGLSGNRWTAIYLGPGSLSACSVSIGAATQGFYNPSGDVVAWVSGGAQIAGIDGTAEGLRLRSTVALSWSSSTNVTSASDLLLVRDAAAVLAQKNGTTAQEFRVYGTTTGSKYASLSHNGLYTHLESVGAGGVVIFKLGTSLLNWDGTQFYPSTDNAFDVGLSNFRFRTGYFGTALAIGATPATAGAIRLTYAEIIRQRSADNDDDLAVAFYSTINSVKNVLRLGDGTGGTQFTARSGGAAPTTSDLPAGQWCVWRDTGGATTKIYYNNAGAIQSVTLT